uniref:Uncharacterized protein n=1 Tax=viral metagenome TaxID=1070528 RepID=A0A6C0HNE2_9ZZZZ
MLNKLNKLYKYYLQTNNIKKHNNNNLHNIYLVCLVCLLLCLLLCLLINVSPLYVKLYEKLLPNNENFIDKSLLINKKYLITFVSGYWNVNNKYNNKYDEWFKNTLVINAPYIFFCTNETKQWIETQNFRQSYPTHFIEKNITDFKTSQLNMSNDIHAVHVPSKELGFVWLEKINLVLESSVLNPYKTEWFAWIDAGICVFRDKAPPTTECPNINKMDLLAKDKFNYCTSDGEKPDSSIKQWNNTHNISGGIFVLHISFIPIFHDLFYKYLNKCISETNTFTCYSDQIILAHIFYDSPELFNKISNGYGTLIHELY